MRERMRGALANRMGDSMCSTTTPGTFAASGYCRRLRNARRPAFPATMPSSGVGATSVSIVTSARLTSTATRMPISTPKNSTATKEVTQMSASLRSYTTSESRCSKSSRLVSATMTTAERALLGR